jgi:hypothetical protein
MFSQEKHLSDYVNSNVRNQGQSSNFYKFEIVDLIHFPTHYSFICFRYQYSILGNAKNSLHRYLKWSSIWIFTSLHVFKASFRCNQNNLENHIRNVRQDQEKQNKFFFTNN